MLKFDENKNIYLTRGDTGTLTLSIKDESDNDYDYSDDTVVFAVKKNFSDTTPAIQKTFANGQVELLPSDTKELDFGDYWYDVQLTHDNGGTDEICTVIIPHTFTIGAEVA